MSKAARALLKKINDKKMLSKVSRDREKHRK